jgi:ElaA protein
MSATGSRDESMRWRSCHFDQLTAAELQNIYMARQQVFTLEQQCLYLDADGVDEHSWHLAAWSATHRMPWAYARVVEPGVKYPEASIGRVITTGPARGTGLGRELVARAMALSREVFAGHGIRISAQSRLERFYAGFGFAIVGERYMEDGIPHTEMVWRPQA